MFDPSTTEGLAACLLGLSLLLLAAYAAIRYRQMRYSLAQAPFYLLNLVYTRIIWRTRVRGRIEFPPGQGGLIVCNHVSSIDPSFVQLGLDRAAHWMVASEYALQPGMSWMFRVVGAIPVSRGGVDTAATKRAIRYATEGELVGIFPEGRINTTRRVLLPGRPGAALIALKARVPVVPAYIRGAPYDGTEYGCFLMSAKVDVRFGAPLDISEFYDREHDKDVLEELTRRIMRAIAALAGVNDFEPSLAGRFYKTERTAEEQAAARSA